MKKFFTLSLLLSLPLSIFSVSSYDTSFELTVLYTGEDRGTLEPCGCPGSMLGGFPKRGTLIDRIKKEAKSTLILCSGNIVAGSGGQSILKYETALAAMEKMGYHALTLGDMDMEIGFENILAALKKHHVPLVCANILLDNRQMFDPFTIYEKNGVKAVIIGVISKRFEEHAQAINRKVRIVDPSLTLLSLMKSIPPDPTLIVLLAHMDMTEAINLAYAYPDIDIVICGQFDPVDRVRKKFPMIEVGDTIIVRSMANGEYLGRLNLTLDIHQKVIKYDQQIIPVSQNIPDSKVILDLLNGYQKRLKEEGLTVEKKPATTPPFVGSKHCRTCHPYEYSIWEGSKHAHAYGSLVNRKRQFDPDCLKCHTTGSEFASGFTTFDKTPHLVGVGCESCHGPGGEHIRNPGEEYGIVTPKVCSSCHTKEKSPEFSYIKYLRKIAH